MNTAHLLKEPEPTDKTQWVKETTAVKYDHDKPQLSLLPATPLAEIARVLAHGAEKYGRDNWRSGMEWTRLTDAALRHLYAFIEGEDLDQDSGINHLAHASCNLLFLLEYISTHPDRDDRAKT